MFNKIKQAAFKLPFFVDLYCSCDAEACLLCFITGGGTSS